MAELNPKALEAASRANRNFGLKRAILAYNAEAGLVERQPMEDTVDEYRALADERGRYVAALREALEQLSDFAPWGGTDFAAFTKWVQQTATAAISDTAQAAALYRPVDGEHVVVPVEPTEKMLKPYDGTGIIPPRNTRALAISLWKAMLAAAPVAKPQAGEGTG